MIWHILMFFGVIWLAVAINDYIDEKIADSANAHRRALEASKEPNRYSTYY